MAAPSSKKQRALELLRDSEIGPSFSSTFLPVITKENYEALANEQYRIWATTWLLPKLVELVPELKGKTISPIGTRTPFKDAA